MTWKFVRGFALVVVGSIAHPACSLSSRPAPAEGAANEDAARGVDTGVAFTQVNVVEVESGRILPEQTVLIAGRRIVAMGPSARMHVPSHTQVVEARGKYLIPGLWDMHAHSSSDRITRATMLPMYVANGVTGVRDMHADCFDPCAADRSTIAQVSGWRRDITDGRLTGPRIVAASQELNGPRPDAPSSVHAPATEDEGRAVVRLLRQRGVDFIKTYDMLPREAYFGLADEARKQAMPFAGHVPVEVRASEASDAGQRSMEHLVGILEVCSDREDELRQQVIARLRSETPRVLSTVLLMADSFSEERCAALYSTFVENGTWHVPTLLVHDKAARMRWRNDPRLRYVTPEERAVWEDLQKYEVETLWGADPEGFARLQRVMSDIVYAMHRAGVQILAGSDAAWVGAFPGFSLHEELELLVAAGLSPAEALRAATLGPAEYLEATDSLGTVAPGKLADLVLLDANPLEDIRNTQRILAVVANGRYFDRDALDRLLANVETAAGGGPDTVHVAPPTGTSDVDRASILTALEQVRPGGTVQFAAGLYHVGELIRATAPETTLQGQPVETRSAADGVRDLGAANRVRGPGTPDTARYTAMPGGIPRGERLVWLEEPNTLRYAMLFGPPGAPNRPRLDSSVEVNAEGIPIRIEVRGFQPHGAPWEERFELRGDTAVWSTPVEQGSRVIAGPAYYPALLAGPMYYPWPAFAAYDLGLLARALLDRPDRSLPLLPDGEARLEELERRAVEVDGRIRTVALYAVHGLDLAPAYVWLDESGGFFADRLSVAAGWEPVYRELAQASRAALVLHVRERLADSIVPARERPLVILGARLFDPATRTVHDGTTIVVEGRRIAAVGPDGSVPAPPGSEVVDAVGRMLLPGLWDMHVHFQPGWSDELSAPLFIAAGVTTTRDLGGETDLVVSLRQRTETGEAVGPRILPALIMYGPEQHALGAGVGTAEEARQAVDRFAALGYVQVKLYNPVPAELVPVIAERARHHGMRMSGHIPNGMTGEEAIEGGFDELQHLLYARVAAAGIRSLATDSAVGPRLAAVRVGDDGWETFVQLLRARGTAIDATLAVVEESVGRNPASWLTPVLDRFPMQAARVASRTAGPSAPPPMLREDWDEIVANGSGLVRALHEAAVPLVLGTDSPIGGFELHREMELFVRAGIPAPDVLEIVTLGAARVMGMDDELGSIEPGKLADLILVDGDPTIDIGDIRRVMMVVKDGRLYDPAALYRALGIRPCCDE